MSSGSPGEQLFLPIRPKGKTTLFELTTFTDTNRPTLYTHTHTQTHTNRQTETGIQTPKQTDTQMHTDSHRHTEPQTLV